jgi:hypothetical protein
VISRQVAIQFQFSVGRASPRAGLGAAKQSGDGSSVASPRQTVPVRAGLESHHLLHGFVVMVRLINSAQC